jgi:CheY-like chemotaxis protein
LADSKNPLSGTGDETAPLRILYVEDNHLVREMTSELLAQDQRRIVALANAEDALREFKRQPFDLVITDVSLPAMSGLDLVRQILELNPAAPIIIASGYFLDLTLQPWGSNVRAIIKPFEGADIDALITEVCAAAGSETTSRSPAPS